MTQGFHEDVKSLMNFYTSATAPKEVVCNQETDTKVSYNLQKVYRSGVGLLIYVVKHS